MREPRHLAADTNHTNPQQLQNYLNVPHLPPPRLGQGEQALRRPEDAQAARHLPEARRSVSKEDITPSDHAKAQRLGGDWSWTDKK